MPTITPNLWFDTEAEEAAEFYTSIFPNSKISMVSHYGEAGPRDADLALTVEFTLDGQPYTGINGGPEFPFTEAVSLLINCADQEEIDYYWDKLTKGGSEVQCGWLRTATAFRGGLRPEGMDEYFTGSDPERSDRVMKAMLKMVKLDIAALEAAADGD